MKKCIAMMLAAFLVLMGLIVILHRRPSGRVADFSYADDLAACGNSPGVYAEGFRNVELQPVRNEDEAAHRAELECRIKYDAVQLAYDDDTDMWRVTFYSAGSLGGDQSVYLDGNGVTQLIVYGE